MYLLKNDTTQIDSTMVEDEELLIDEEGNILPRGNEDNEISKSKIIPPSIQIKVTYNNLKMKKVKKWKK